MSLFLSSLSAPFTVGLFYPKYNEQKEEFERKIGYPDSSRGHYGGRTAKNKMIDKRVVLARCIYGMYYRCRGYPASEYKSWWDSLHYDLVPIEVVLGDESQRYNFELRQEKENRYFGVLQRRKNKHSGLPDHGAPRWIVAVRGTDVYKLQELWTDEETFRRRLGDFSLLLAVLTRIARIYGPKNVILTGHSLGASAALLAGHSLAKEGTYIEAHFFNPPFVTLVELVRLTSGYLNFDLNNRLDKSDIEQVTGGEKQIRDFIRDRLEKGLEYIHEEKKKLKRLTEWVPHIYVNTHDQLSRSFVQYFTKEPVASSTKIVRTQEEEAFHLLPRAVLHISKKHKLRILSAHMLWNWTRPDLPYEMLEVNLIAKSDCDSHGKT